MAKIEAEKRSSLSEVKKGSDVTELKFRLSIHGEDLSLIHILFIGIFIELVTHSGGVDALTQYILKVATNRRRTLLSTFVLGLCFFIGDVSNIGTIGAAMKKTADKNRVPREALAYILDSTAAPVCILVPVSSWGVFFAGLFMACLLYTSRCV